MQTFETVDNIRLAEMWARGLVTRAFAVWCTGTALACLAPIAAMAGPLPSGANLPRVAWGFVENGNQECDCFLNVKKRGAVYVAYLGTGSYQVELEGIDPPGPDDVQVSSADNVVLSYCVTAGWSVDGHRPGLTTVDVTVDCYDGTGNPADALFSFLYQSRAKPFGSADKGNAFLLADQPTEASYTPNPDYQYNSTGAVNTMLRNGTGSYTASIPNLTKKGGNVQVTAYGSNASRCKVSTWSAGQSATSVNVLCFDGTGAAADEMFTLAYTIAEPMGQYQYQKSLYYGDTGAYAWANRADQTKTYTPPHAYNYNGFGTGGLTVERQETGLYAVTLPGEGGFDYAAALVTANGSGNTACTANNGAMGYDPVKVYCYDQNGNPVDSTFSVLLQTAVKN